MKGQKILLIGALGFIGSNIARRLISDGYNVDCYDDCSFGSMQNLSPEMKYSPLSFQGITSDAYLEMFDICVFVACSNLIYAQDHPIEVFKNNALDSIEFFKKFKGKIVFTSTTSVYGQADILPTPENAKVQCTNSYDTSKRIAELFLLQRGNTTILRLSNCFGDWQRPENPYCGVVAKFISQSLHSEPITIIGGLQTRDYTYVGDVCDAIILAVEQDAKNDICNIATGIETSIEDLITMVLTETKNYNHGILRIEPRSIDKINRRCLSIEKAKRELNWQPKTTLIEGLKKTISWQQQEYHNK